MGKELLDAFAMLDAIPGRDFAALVVDDEPMFDPIKQQQYVGVVQRLAVPYKVDNRRRATRSELPPSYLNASTGLVASVRDLAKFDSALSTLVRPDTLEKLWTNQ